MTPVHIIERASSTVIRIATTNYLSAHMSLTCSMPRVFGRGSVAVLWITETHSRFVLLHREPCDRPSGNFHFTRYPPSLFPPLQHLCRLVRVLASSCVMLYARACYIHRCAVRSHPSCPCWPGFNGLPQNPGHFRRHRFRSQVLHALMPTAAVGTACARAAVPLRYLCFACGLYSIPLNKTCTDMATELS